MDAKVVRITMIPKAFPRSKKERILFIEPRLLAGTFTGSVLYEQD